MLNIMWPIFIIASLLYAIIFGDISSTNNSIFNSLESAIEFSLVLIGTMCFWSGIMKVATKTTLLKKFTKLLNPIVTKIFPETRNNKEIKDYISMNIISNIMGLGNAATPTGIKAMKSMQKENKKKNILTNSMARFIVLNTASIQIIPTTVIAIRSSLRL